MRAMRKLVASTILLILSFGLALVGIWPASVSGDVGPQKVQVVNTPLPVSVQGTTSITGNVNVATLPAVTLAAGTAVKINNPPEQPVLVREVSNGAEVARLGVSWVIPSGQNGIEQSVFTVPTGKNLVIEHAAMSFRISSGLNLKPLIVSLLCGSSRDEMIPHLMGGGFGLDFYSVTHQTRFYCQSGEDLRFW